MSKNGEEAESMESMRYVVYEDDRPWCGGEPVHCGDMLEVRLPGRGWTRVRIERAWTQEGPGNWYWIDGQEQTGILAELTPARWPGRWPGR